MQKRHDEGDNFARAAAILSSIDFVTSSSVASSDTSFSVDVVFAVGDVAALSPADAKICGFGPSEDLRDIAALISFSLCFLDWICERYAFSVVYALLEKHRDEWNRRYKMKIQHTCKLHSSSLSKMIRWMFLVSSQGLSG